MKNFKSKDDDPPSMTENFSEDEDPGGEPSPNRKIPVNTAETIPILKKMRLKLARILNVRRKNSIEKDVAELINEHDPEGTQVGSEERSILNNVLNISDTKVSDVMVPRTDIVAIDKYIALNKLKDVIIEKEHTRTPVYHDSLDNVIGFLHIKDLIPLIGTKKPFKVEQVLREILYVPPSMKILDLLVMMRNKRVHVAVVLDEYGGTDGLVTMEDLMEEIVGEIEDEHDEIEEVAIKKIDKNSYEVSARVAVKELEKVIKTKLKQDDMEEDFETVGGLIFFLLGRVPEKDEIIEHPNDITFQITDADPRRIKKLIAKKNS